MFEQVIDSLRRAAAGNRGCPLRRGNVIAAPPDADAIVSGDLHGRGDNLLRIETLADLDRRPARHVVLQELIHPLDAAGAPGGDGSHHLVTRAARWQLRCPGQVHVILGNHELAQMTGQDILKGGTGLCRQFERAVRDHYADEADDVMAAMNDYFCSLPLAWRSDGGLAVVHSLPSERMVGSFDATIFARAAVEADLARRGSAYELVWGRTHARPAIDAIKAALDARVLVIGHLPQPTGLQVVADDLLVIASDHSAGVALPVAAGPPPPAAVLAGRAVRLNSVSLD